MIYGRFLALFWQRGTLVEYIGCRLFASALLILKYSIRSNTSLYFFAICCAALVGMCAFIDIWTLQITMQSLQPYSRGVNRLNGAARTTRAGRGRGYSIIPVHGAKEVVIVVVVRGDNLRWGAVDGNGRLADVREVVPGDDFHVGYTGMGDQTGPGVKTCKMSVVSLSYVWWKMTFLRRISLAGQKMHFGNSDNWRLTKHTIIICRISHNASDRAHISDSLWTHEDMRALFMLSEIEMIRVENFIMGQTPPVWTASKVWINPSKDILHYTHTLYYVKKNL